LASLDTHKQPTKVSFIGFGEAARAFSTGFRQEGMPLDLHAFDIKSTGTFAAEMQRAFDDHVVMAAAKCSDVCADTGLIFSLVTADQAANAAHAAAGVDISGAFFLDCNSCAPDTKRRSAEVINAAGGRYVDVAVMTPVHPRLHKTPCLLAGAHAKRARTELQKLGMEVEIAGPLVGDASTRKMIRSVMIKGLEALTLECFLAARKAGVDGDILASLEAGFPGFDWQRRAPYMMERVATHGIRRAAEMEEVAQTLRDLGLAPHVTEGTVARQREIGNLGLDVSKKDATNLAKLSDAILNGLAATTSPPNKEG
jgi:3-hydroxyisobutyrate dehydrogenase-like beta-hydroxyacid dehydrogenase